MGNPGRPFPFQISVPRSEMLMRNKARVYLLPYTRVGSAPTGNNLPA